MLILFLQCAVFVSWPCTYQIGKFLLLLATLLFVLVFKATKCLRLFLRTWRTFHAYVLENVAWHVSTYVAYSKQQTANSKQQAVNSKRQTANGKQQTANGKQQTTNSKPQTTNGKQQTANSKQHTANNKKQSANSKQ